MIRCFRFLPLLLAGACALRAETAPVPKPKPPGVITLEEAYDRALATDQSIRIAYLEVRKARLLPWSALTRIAPQLLANGNYRYGESALTRTFTETTGDALDVNGVQVRSVELTSHTRSGAAAAGFSLQQPLIDMTVFPAYRAGKLSAESARLQHRFTVRGTLFGVAQAYYAVLEQQRLVEVNRDTQRLAQEQLDLATIRANVGEVTRSDILRAEVTFQTARRTLIENENILESRVNTLSNILNYPPGTRLRITEPPDFPTTLPPFEELLKRANDRREDLQVQDLAVKQDIERKKIVLGEYAPRVTANFDGDIANNTGTSSSKQRAWQATVGVSVPIFTGGQREIDLATARLQIQQTQLNRDTLAKTIEQEVKDAWLTVRSLEETLKALRTQVVAADQGYEDIQNQYRAGEATSVDVLSALNDLNTGRSDLNRQTYNYQVALRNLEQVTGTFQERRVNQVKIR
jgi:outer membrane protein